MIKEEVVVHCRALKQGFQNAQIQLSVLMNLVLNLFRAERKTTNEQTILTR